MPATPATPTTTLSADVRECMKDCGDCAAICAATAHHCLGLGGEHSAPKHQAIMRDCAQACALAVGFMSRLSGHSREVCRLCAALCAECATDCERIYQGDPMMRECAQECRACGDSCRKMAAT